MRNLCSVSASVHACGDCSNGPKAGLVSAMQRLCCRVLNPRVSINRQLMLVIRVGAEESRGTGAQFRTLQVQLLSFVVIGRPLVETILQTSTPQMHAGSHAR